MAIEQTRVYNYKSPNLPSIKKWLKNKLTISLEQAVTSAERNKINYRYNGVSDADIWIENVSVLGDSLDTYLGCFSVVKKGYAVLDARLPYTNFDDIIDYFAIPIINIENYNELFKAIKAGAKNSVYKVNSGSGKYGVIVDNRLTDSIRYNTIIQALNGVSFNVTVNYTGESISLNNPYVGEVALSWPGFISTTLEVYPLEEILLLE